MEIPKAGHGGEKGHLLKSTWNGVIVEGGIDRDDVFTIVIHPLEEVTPEVRKRLSESCGMSPLDIKIKVRPGGYIALLRGMDFHEMQGAMLRLRAAGFVTSLFRNTFTFDIPVMEVFHNGSADGSRIVFGDDDNPSSNIVERGDRVLVVMTTIAVNSVTVAGPPRKSVGLGLNPAMPVKIKTRPAAKIEKTEYVGVADLFNFSREQHTRLTAGNFHFKGLLGDMTARSFNANMNVLLHKIRGIAGSVTVDERYDASSIPLPSSSIRKGVVPGGTTMGFADATKITRDDFCEFTAYSRFRYIVERYR